MKRMAWTAMAKANTSAHLRAALFDLDGTLMDTEPRSRAAWKRLFDAHGVPCDDAVLASFTGRRAHDILAGYLPHFGGCSVDALYAEAVAHSQSPDIPRPIAVAGAVSFVRDLYRRRVPVGVVTSGARDYAHGLLDDLGLGDLLAVVITADDVQKGKPDPQGFLAGCRALGVPPAQAVAFEDAPAGLAAARAAGMRCVALATTHAASELAHADLVVNDFTRLKWPLKM